MIRTYAAADAEPCAILWNRMQGALPAFVPVDGESMHRGIVAPDSFHDEVREATAVLDASAEGVSGWVALCRRRSGPAAPWHAVVRAICAEPAAVPRLLDGAREWAGADRLVVGGSGGLRFLNGGDGALPESSGLAPHLVRWGMRLTSRGLILEGPVEDEAEPSGAIQVVSADDRGSSRALADGQTVGECWVDLASAFSSRPEANGRAFVQWIGTERDWRGRGVARAMWAHTCRRLRAAGVRRISLSTPCDNFAAQAFYYRVGLRVVDQGLGFELPPGPLD